MALMATLALGAWAWKRRAYFKGYADGEADSVVARQVRAAFAPPCWCDHPSNASVGISRAQCATSGRCCISGKLVTLYYRGRRG